VLVGFLQHAVVIDVRAVAVRVGEAVEVAADHRLRLVALGDRDRLEALLPGADVCEAAKKFTKFVPSSRSCAITALLSPFDETWQSTQVLVSVARTCAARACSWPGR